MKSVNRAAVPGAGATVPVLKSVWSVVSRAGTIIPISCRAGSDV
jgi:hypothetical protein